MGGTESRLKDAKVKSSSNMRKSTILELKYKKMYDLQAARAKQEAYKNGDSAELQRIINNMCSLKRCQLAFQQTTTSAQTVAMNADLALNAMQTKKILTDLKDVSQITVPNGDIKSITKQQQQTGILMEKLIQAADANSEINDVIAQVSGDQVVQQDTIRQQILDELQLNMPHASAKHYHNSNASQSQKNMDHIKLDTKT